MEKIINIKLDTTDFEAITIKDLLQNAVNVIDREDFIKLLKKVKSNPKIVKTALKFI